MIYLLLYLVHLIVYALTGGVLSPSVLVLIALMTVPGWFAVWYASRKLKGSLR